MQIQSTHSQMGRLSLFFSLILFFQIHAFSQMYPVEYKANIDTAKKFFNEEDFCSASKYYEQAFDNKQAFCIDVDILDAVISSAKCNKKIFFYKLLSQLVYELGYYNYDVVLKKLNTTKFIKESRFNKIIKYSKLLKINMKKPFKKDIAIVLDSVYYRDQFVRNNVTDNNVIDSVDNFNYKVVDSIYKIYGWLSKSEVGNNASIAQFLVIQHSNLKIQKQSIKRVSNAIKLGLLPPSNYALLIDRILIGEQKKQIFGTQLFFNDKDNKYEPYPIKDIKVADILREKLGMQKLSNYIQQYNL